MIDKQVLDEIRAKFGHLTDKFSLGYFEVYAGLLAFKPAAAVLEVGTAAGGSLMVWHELCPEGTVVGVDLSAPSVMPEGAVHVIANQVDPELPGKVAPYGPYDLIIDDAGHFGSQSGVTLQNLWPLVKPGGWYVLEDWTVGLPDNPYFPAFDGTSMARLAKSFVGQVTPDRDLCDMGGTCIAAGGPESVTEIRYRYGMAMLRKKPA